MSSICGLTKAAMTEAGVSRPVLSLDEVRLDAKRTGKAQITRRVHYLMDTKTHTTLSPETVASLGLTIPTTFTKQMENAILNLPCVPGFVMFPEPYKKSTDDYTGFPKGSLLMRYDGQLFVVDLLFITGDKRYSLTSVTKSGYEGHSDSPSRHWVHEYYLFVGQKVAK